MFNWQVPANAAAGIKIGVYEKSRDLACPSEMTAGLVTLGEPNSTLAHCQFFAINIPAAATSFIPPTANKRVGIVAPSATPKSVRSIR